MSFYSDQQLVKRLFNAPKENLWEAYKMPKRDISALLLFSLLMSHSSGNLYIAEKKTLTTAVRLYLQETSQAPVLLGHFGHDVPLLNFHRARSTFSEVKLYIRSPEHDFQKKSAWMLLVQAPADINREKVSPVLS